MDGDLGGNLVPGQAEHFFQDESFDLVIAEQNQGRNQDEHERRQRHLVEVQQRPVAAGVDAGDVFRQNVSAVVVQAKDGKREKGEQENLSGSENLIFGLPEFFLGKSRLEVLGDGRHLADVATLATEDSFQLSLEIVDKDFKLIPGSIPTPTLRCLLLPPEHKVVYGHFFTYVECAGTKQIKDGKFSEKLLSGCVFYVRFEPVTAG